MDKETEKSRPEYSIPGISGNASIGHATKVLPIDANAAQKDMSKIKWIKPDHGSYDPKAFDYKY